MVEERPRQTHSQVPQEARPLPWATLFWFALAVLVVGFAGGFSLNASLQRRRVPATKKDMASGPDKPIRGTDPAKVEVEAPGLLATRLRLINVSQEGNGWAPWQFAVSGDTTRKKSWLGDGDAHHGPCTSHCDMSDSPISWRNFNDVWVLTLDPDAVQGVEYRDEERIAMRVWLNLENELEEPCLMHFHGFTPPNNLDGIPFISANPLRPGSQVFYDFTVRHRGFYWLHSHFGHQLEAGLLAPIIVKDHPQFLAEIGNPIEVPMIVFDGHWRTECAYQSHMYPKECPTGGFDSYDEYQITVNNYDLRSGKAHEVTVAPGTAVRLRILEAGAMAVFRIHFDGLEAEVLATDGRRIDRGHFVESLDMAGAERFDVLLNIPKKEGSYHIVAQRTTTHHSLGANSAERGVLVLKTKNSPPRELPSAYSPDPVEPYTIDAFRNQYSYMRPHEPLENPHAPPHVLYRVKLTGDYDKSTGEWKPNFDVNNEKVFVWPHRVWCRNTCVDDADPAGTVLDMFFCQGRKISSNIHCTTFACNESSTGRDDDGRCMPEHATMNEWKGVPVSDCNNWGIRPELFHSQKSPMKVCQGDRVWIRYVSETPYEGHPMHLHGTHQQLIMINGNKVSGPVKDTWFVPKGQEITVAFDAVNPGTWLLHCHIGHHVNEGMSTLLTYTVDHELCSSNMWYGKRPKPSFEYTKPLPFSDWPENWKQLWRKQPPQH